MVETTVSDEGVVRFGEFEMDPRSGELRKAGRKVRLQEKPARLLAALIDRSGEVVTREELASILWGADTFVDFDNGLNNAVSRVRKALGDAAGRPRFVETVGRRGYRFIGPLEAPANREEPGPAPTSSAPDPPPSPARSRVVLASLLGSALLAGLVAVAVTLLRPESGRAKVMLAVLPFEDLDGNASQAYFGDGLTEEMIAGLGALRPEELGVIARTTAMHYKKTAKPADQIARELGVDYLLEGGVRRSGARVRITVRLIRCRDQTPVWSREYEGEVRDVLSAQKEVARGLVDELRLQVSPRARAALAQARPVDPLSYEAYLRGRYAWDGRTTASLREAIGHFQAAAAREPAFAPAYAGLADAYSLLPYYAGAAPREAFPAARAAAERAVELDPMAAEAHTSLAYVLHHYEWHWTRAEAEYRRALELNPSYAIAHHWYAELLVNRGRLEEARRELREAQRLDPFSPRIGLDVALPDFFEGRFDRVIDAARRVLDAHPAFLPAHVTLREAFQRQERYAEAAAELAYTAGEDGLGREAAGQVAAAYAAHGPEGYWRALLQLAERGLVPLAGPTHRAGLHWALGDRKRTFELLEEAYAQKDDELIWLAVDHWEESARADPRFAVLLEKLGLDTVAPARPALPRSDS